MGRYSRNPAEGCQCTYNFTCRPCLDQCVGWDKHGPYALMNRQLTDARDNRNRFKRGDKHTT